MITPEQIAEVDRILAPFNEAAEADKLTRELWIETWRKLEPILGDESEGMEMLITYAQPGWLRAVRWGR